MDTLTAVFSFLDSPAGIITVLAVLLVAAAFSFIVQLAANAANVSIPTALLLLLITWGLVHIWFSSAMP